MFPKDIQDWMIAAYLESGLELLQNQTFKQMVEVPKRGIRKVLTKEINKTEAELQEIALRLGRTKDSEGRDTHLMQLEARLYCLKSAFYAQEVPPILQQQAADLIVNHNMATGANIKPTRKEFESFSLRVLDAEIKQAEIEHATINNGSSHFIESELQSLKSRTASRPISLQEAVTLYLDWYSKENSSVKSFDSAVVPQCNMLLELLGPDASMAKLNTYDSITDLIGVLQKYPVNKVKLFGAKSLATIIRSGVPYDVISKRTAEGYLGRLRSIIGYLISRDTLTGTNKAENRHVLTKKDKEESAPDTERLPYDEADMLRLVDALCTKPFYTRGEERNERFWLILIGILYGIRTGNIVALTKSHIVEDNGIFCFDLTQLTRQQAKTADARRNKLPINPALIELGFLEWVDSLKRQKLFRDSVDSFSRWYNRNESDKKTGKIVHQGFEPRYITTDRKKCFYSQRHNFQEACEEAGIDFKYIKQMVGHKQDTRDQTRSRYTRLAKPEKLLSIQQQVIETFKNLGIDLVRLRQRAIELFPAIQQAAE